MRRWRLTLRYDGTRYHGWQVQPNGVTVQQVLQDAIEAVTGVRAGVTGCSRTDAGVHAEMFCCAFETDSALSDVKMIAALNAHLPSDVAVYACDAVAADFHPRYDALGKRYVYRIWNSTVRHPFEAPYSLHYPYELDVERLNAAAADFVGTHDFAAFCAAGSTVEDTVRTVRLCTVTRQGERVLFTVEADGFLYNMVRIMVGTLLDMAHGRIAYEAIPSILASKDRNKAGATAPAKGLFLDTVYYKDENYETT